MIRSPRFRVRRGQPPRWRDLERRGLRGGLFTSNKVIKEVKRCSPRDPSSDAVSVGHLTLIYWSYSYMTLHNAGTYRCTGFLGNGSLMGLFDQWLCTEFPDVPAHMNEEGNSVVYK